MDGNPEDLPVELIPGIGVIRARSLKKAGWPTVASLQAASVADLLAVPGITEIKAAQILHHVKALLGRVAAEGNGHAAQSIAPPDVAGAPEDHSVPDTIEITFETPSLQEEQVPVYAIQSPRDLMQDIALSAQLLLTSEFAGKWERPFVEQLGKLISLHQKWDRYEPLGKKQSKQVMELLQKMYRLLTETPIADITKRKSQDRLAEELRSRRRKVRDILAG